jgi:hypothetical protein
MGNGSSRSATLEDVSRVRDWLLVGLSHCAARGDRRSLRTWLATQFRRHDTVRARSFVGSVIERRRAH